MKKLIQTCLAAATVFCASSFFPAKAVQDGEPLMLALRDGGILFASIEGHSPDELVVHRIDTGGRLVLPWGLLDPAKERELKLGYGYIEAAFEEEFVQADKLNLRDGTQLIGVIVGRTETTLMVKNSQALISLPLERVVGQSVFVQVPASEIYSREERYQMKLKEYGFDLGSSDSRIVAQAHVDLAGWCEGLRDFGRALTHYQAVAVADPTWPLEDLRPSLERTTIKAAAQTQVDYLGDVERLTRRGNFAKSLNMLAEFSVLFPDSPLMDDWNVQRERTLKAQLKALQNEVAKRWHAAAALQARSAARLETYSEVKNYLGERMGEEILKRVTADLHKLSPNLLPEEVAVLFSERTGGRWRKASYGIGTWMLGEKEARAGIEKKTEKKAKGEQDALRDSIAEKVKRYMENQAAVSAASGADSGLSPEEYWQYFSINSRSNWILAYYAEHSGVMELRKALFANCRECGGVGAREVVNLGSAREGQAGSVRVETCSVCQGVGVTRRVSYR